MTSISWRRKRPIVWQRVGDKFLHPPRVSPIACVLPDNVVTSTKSSSSFPSPRLTTTSFVLRTCGTDAVVVIDVACDRFNDSPTLVWILPLSTSCNMRKAFFFSFPFRPPPPLPPFSSCYIIFYFSSIISLYRISIETIKLYIWI